MPVAGYYYQSGTFTIAKDYHEIVQKIKEAADALITRIRNLAKHKLRREKPKLL